MNSIESLKQKLSEAHIWEASHTFQRWDYLKREDSANTNLYFIDEGCVRVYFKEGEYEHSLYFGYKNSLISALDSFLSENTSPILIQCLQKTTVRIISKSKFNQFIKEDSVAFNLWLEALSELNQFQLEREKDLLIQSPRLRYNRVLSRQPLLFQYVPHKYIASYLRMTPETLSRILNS